MPVALVNEVNSVLFSLDCEEIKGVAEPTVKVPGLEITNQHPRYRYHEFAGETGIISFYSGVGHAIEKRQESSHCQREHQNAG